MVLTRGSRYIFGCLEIETHAENMTCCSQQLESRKVVTTRLEAANPEVPAIGCLSSVVIIGYFKVTLWIGRKEGRLQAELCSRIR